MQAKTIKRKKKREKKKKRYLIRFNYSDTRLGLFIHSCLGKTNSMSIGV